MTLRRTLAVVLSLIGLTLVLSSMIQSQWLMHFAVGCAVGMVNVAALMWRGRAVIAAQSINVTWTMTKSFISRASLLILALFVIRHYFAHVYVVAVLIGFFLPQAILWIFTLLGREEVNG